MKLAFKPCFITAASLLTACAFAQVPNPGVVQKIKDEGMNHSQFMKTLEYLSDMIGPRLTGSPSLLRANNWTKDTMTSWGLSNAHLEAWGPFGRGWELERFEAQVISPQDMPLIAFPKAWSPEIHGPVTADVVLVDAVTEADLAKYKGQLKGKIVLNGAPAPVAARFVSQGSRYTDDELDAMTKPVDPNRPRRGGAPGGPNVNAFRQRAAINAAKYRMFVEEGALAVLDASRGDDGTITVQSATVPTPPLPATPTSTVAPTTRRVWEADAPQTVPQVVVSSEQYNRMARMIANGEKLTMSLDVRVKFFDKDPMAYNTVAELPGSDLKDQVVMCGGHMDSWHAGTGATDNGAGLAVAMEAIRILKAAGLQPRRTVRVALWSGEEEGLYGSQNYVAQHFGKMVADPTPPASLSVQAAPGAAPAQAQGTRHLEKKPEWDNISAYYNLDNGSGKIRGIYCQGNDKVASIFQEWLTPFADMGAKTVTLRNTGSTDHVSFDAVGIPGFQFIQDPIEYETRTHHTNQDVFDRIQEDDMKQAAVVLATFLYMTANRDDKLPRKELYTGPSRGFGG